jgi:hypothetical protein
MEQSGMVLIQRQGAVKEIWTAARDAQRDSLLNA